MLTGGSLSTGGESEPPRHVTKVRLDGFLFPRLSVLGVVEVPAGDFALNAQRPRACLHETANESRVLLSSFIFFDSVPARSYSAAASIKFFITNSTSTVSLSASPR